MDTNNKQQRTDLNQEAANKIPHNQQENKTAADFEATVREAEAERQELKPGQTNGGNSSQHNNGRGGGK